MLFHHNLIGKHPSLGSLGLNPDVSGAGLATPRQLPVFGGRGFLDRVCIAVYFLEQGVVAAYADTIFGREIDFGAAALHKVGSYVRYVLHRAEVDGYIHAIVLAYETLPSSVAKCPSAKATVGKCGLALSPILAVVRLVVHNLAAPCLVSCYAQRGRALAILMLKTEGVDPSLPKKGGMSQGTFAEVGKVLGLGSVPCRLGYGQSSGVQHVFGMLLGRNILAPEVALNASNLGLLGFGQVGTRHICVNLVQRQVSPIASGCVCGAS